MKKYQLFLILLQTYSFALYTKQNNAKSKPLSVISSVHPFNSCSKIPFCVFCVILYLHPFSYRVAISFRSFRLFRSFRNTKKES